MPLPIPVTLLYGGATAILVALLGMRVSFTRLARRVYIGAEVDPSLHRIVRAHGNAAEWSPLLLVLLLLVELGGGHAMRLHIYGGAIFFARAIHALGVYTRARLTVLGATLTYVLVIAMSVQCLSLHFRH